MEGNMNICNLVLTSKGGAGKSFVSWVIAQWGMTKGYNMYCADTDPANPTFAGYKALQVDYIDVANEKMLMDRDRFDDLLEKLASHDGFSVVDTGATMFYPFLNHAIEVKTFEALRDGLITPGQHASPQSRATFLNDGAGDCALLIIRAIFSRLARDSGT